MTVFLGTLWSSIKQIKAPYMFYGEHRFALHTMQGNRVSSHGEGAISWFFSSCGDKLFYIRELRPGWTFKTRVCSLTSGLLSSYEGPFRYLPEAWQGNTDASHIEVGDPV